MAQIDLKEKFPQMTPVKSAPALFRINGCGFGMYGSRDRDPETGAYVANWCLSLLFVPVLCLRAYRIAKADQGWYFLGREPLSGLARALNIVVLVAVLGIIGAVQYQIHTSSPAYKAHQQFLAATDLVNKGQLAQAGKMFQSLAMTSNAETANAEAAIKNLLDNQCLQAPLSEACPVFIAAAQLAHRSQSFSTREIADKTLKLVTEKGQSDPRVALDALDTIRDMVMDPRPIDAQRLPLLKKLVASQPGNLQLIISLASLLENQHQYDEAKKLLLPNKDKLGDGEGARVMGNLLAHDGDLDGAYKYLWPYVQARLTTLHSAEHNVEDTYKQLYDREIKVLNENKGPKEFYERYNNAGTDEQRALVDDHIEGIIKDDPQLLSALESLQREKGVVTVAVDLGMLMLQRAQSLPDPAQRKTELEATEKVFLSVGKEAAKDDLYRLSLGQIYYWLGKQDEGRKLFDAFLQAKGRDFKSLLQVAHFMRELGSIPEARKTAEEAYGKASKAEEQHAAAAFRALCSIDSDDEIAWLNKADLTQSPIRSALALAVAQKAIEEGRDDEAARQYQIASEAYASMPRTAFSLNQNAIAQNGIFMAVGDRQAFERALDYFQQAVALSPTDTVVIGNAGAVVLEGAVTELIGKQIDPQVLRRGGRFPLLGYLFRDSASRDAVARRFREHPAVARALSFFDKLAVLSPRSGDGYAMLDAVYSFTRDEKSLEDLLRRLQQTTLDTSDRLARIKESLSGAKDQQTATTTAASLSRYTALADALRPKGGLSAAVAISKQAESLMRLDRYTHDSDPEKVLTLASEAHQLAPSAATHSILREAYEFRLTKHLVASQPAFSSFFKKCDRSVDLHRMIAVAASEPGPLQQPMLQQTDFKKIVEILREDGMLFPERESASSWAMLKNADPTEAQAIAANISKSKMASISQSISNILAPYSADEALDTYWLMQILNKPEEGKQALRKLAAEGIPLPIDVK